MPETTATPTREIKPGDVVHGMTVHDATFQERRNGASGPAWVLLGTRQDTDGPRWLVERINDHTGAQESGGMTCTDQADAERIYRLRTSSDLYDYGDPTFAGYTLQARNVPLTGKG